MTFERIERIQKLKQGQRSIGLRIMSYRARSIGGSLAFVRNEAGGMDLICTVTTTGEHEAKE